MNTNKTPKGSEISTRYEEAKLSNDKIEAEKLAYKSEAQGQYLADHVLGMLEDGKTEDRAKVGRFPRRYPDHMDNKTVTLATNAALKERDADVKVGIYNAAIGDYDGISNTVVVTHIDGEKIPTSKLYDMRKNDKPSPFDNI